MPQPGPVRTTGRYLRIAVITLVVLGFVPLLGVTGARFMGGDSTPATQLSLIHI